MVDFAPITSMYGAVHCASQVCIKDGELSECTSYDLYATIYLLRWSSARRVVASGMGMRDAKS